MSGPDNAVSKEDVATFSTKLEQWGATLAPKERALLDVLVKLAGRGLPPGSELLDDQLEGVAGGTDPGQLQGLARQTSSVFGRIAGDPGLASGGYVIPWFSPGR